MDLRDRDQIPEEVSAAVARGMAVVDTYERRSHILPRGPLEGSRCPCCGQDALFEKPVVFLNLNTLSFQKQTLKLTRTAAEIAHVLTEEMPRAVSRGVLIERVWGAFDEKDYLNTVEVFLVRLRRDLKPLGLQIETIRHFGWRMKVDAA
jgi:DNA-binding response OmpR family regulator